MTSSAKSANRYITSFPAWSKTPFLDNLLRLSGATHAAALTEVRRIYAVCSGKPSKQKNDI
jgi:hypothetical protein